MMILVENVTKSFDDINVLEGVSFTLNQGERASLIGPGGCGKSTLLKIILGLTPADQGQVRLCETDMVEANESEKRETLKRVGMAFQQGALFDYMTVKENLIFAMENMTELSRQDMNARVTDLLEGVKLARTSEMFPHELSGGMRRRVGIARALATDPAVAIFDEPTSGLDPVTSTIILNMIKDLEQGREGVTSLVATSAVEVAIRFAERLIVINEGVIAADGLWRDLLVSGPEWVRHFLSVRLIGLDLEYARDLRLPEKFIEQHW